MGDQGNYYGQYTGLDMSRVSADNRLHLQLNAHPTVSTAYYGMNQRTCLADPGSYPGSRSSNPKDVKPIVIEPRINHPPSINHVGRVPGFSQDERFNSCSSPPDDLNGEGESWMDSESESRAGSRSRSERKPISDDLKDNKYYERRHRNNDAAKRSRDARKKRMEAIIHRSNILEHENLVLRAQRSTLFEQLCTMREMAVKRGKRMDFSTSSSGSDMKSL